MHVRFARYRFEGDAPDLARRVEAGLLPIFEAQDGFKAYSVGVDGDEVFSFSVWDSAEHAAQANTAAADWVKEHMSEVDLQESRILELLLSTALGVSPSAAARS